MPATYLPRDGHDEKAETLDALDFVARLLAHVPDPRRHLVHCYGAYSNVVRGKLKAQSQAQRAESLASGPGALSPPPAALASPSLAALRRGWAQLPRRVYEIDPLVCPRCRRKPKFLSLALGATSDGLEGPEFGIQSSTTAIARVNFVQALATTGRVQTALYLVAGSSAYQVAR